MGIAVGPDFIYSESELINGGRDVAIGNTLPGQTLRLGIVAGTLDNATNNLVGLGQTQLGPETIEPDYRVLFTFRPDVPLARYTLISY